MPYQMPLASASGLVWQKTNGFSQTSDLNFPYRFSAN
jgi:hypothetical protein